MKEMPKFGLMINPAYDIVKQIKEIKSLGFDFAELTIEPPNALPEKIKKKSRQIMEAKKAFEHPLVGHTAWWLEPGTEYEAVRLAVISEFKKAVDVCRLLGIEFMNIHATTYGLYFGKEKKIVLDKFVLGLKELKRYAANRGVKIMLENVPEKKELSTFKSFRYLIDGSGVFVHLDIPHAFVVGGMKEIKSYTRTFGNRIAHIHIHDNHGDYDEHLPLGGGSIDFVSVVKELKKINYSKTVTFEVFTSRKDAVASREYFKKLWVKS